MEELMQPSGFDLICDCCQRCEFHCLCDDSCENTWHQVNDESNECIDCTLEEKEYE